jgi:phosphoglycolate phosphatase-like HAD superfamily hydrolase
MIIALDFDGVLLDSRARHTVLLDDILVERGISADTSDYFAFKADGHSTKEWLAAHNLPPDIAREWAERIEWPKYLALDKFYPDAEEFCAGAQALGHALYLITHRKDAAAAMEQVAPIRKYLSDALAVPHSVDKAPLFGRINAQLAIGDCETEQHAATASGAKFIAISRGFRSKQFWARRGISALLQLPKPKDL